MGDKTTAKCAFQRLRANEIGREPVDTVHEPVNRINYFAR